MSTTVAPRWFSFLSPPTRKHWIILLMLGCIGYLLLNDQLIVYAGSTGTQKKLGTNSAHTNNTSEVFNQHRSWGDPRQTSGAGCPKHARAQFLKDRCQTSPVRNYTYDNDLNQSLRYVVVDEHRKLFYCLIGKAASKSFSQFMVKSENENAKIGHLRHNNYPGEFGLKMVHNLPLEDAITKYKDYYKFLIVRHPLQRIVSAYYEIIVRKFVRNRSIYHTENGHMMNLTEYIGLIASNLMDRNPHWTRYINRCKVCKVEYDYVMRTETIVSDVEDFTGLKRNGTTRDVRLTHQNQFINPANRTSDSAVNHYKYDAPLHAIQRENPELMKTLLNVYGDDMELFGYKWDWEGGKSSCGYDYNGTTCC